MANRKKAAGIAIIATVVAGYFASSWVFGGFETFLLVVAAWSGIAVASFLVIYAVWLIEQGKKEQALAEIAQRNEEMRRGYEILAKESRQER